MNTYDYYDVYVPADCAGTVEERANIAIDIARERARLYCLPAEWRAERIEEGVEELYRVRRKRRRRVWLGDVQREGLIEHAVPDGVIEWEYRRGHHIQQDAIRFRAQALRNSAQRLRLAAIPVVLLRNGKEVRRATFYCSEGSLPTLPPEGRVSGISYKFAPDVWVRQEEG